MTGSQKDMLTNNLHAMLKERTSIQHSQIENTPLVSKLINKTITLSEYQLLIRKFYGYIAPCEELIQKLTCRYLLIQREKSLCLLSDLAVFGIEKHSVEFSCYLPQLKTYEQVLGYMYVMEGSTLGGQIIAKMLQETLNLTPENGASYFYGYGKNTRNKWAEFCQLLDERKHNEHTKEIIIAASQTYSTLNNWMLD